MYTLAFLGSIGTPELIVLAILALLIFGRRLPEVGRNLGKGIVEFKKGLAGIEDDVNRNGAQPNQLPADQQRQLPPQPNQPQTAQGQQYQQPPTQPYANIPQQQSQTPPTQPPQSSTRA